MKWFVERYKEGRRPRWTVVYIADSEEEAKRLEETVKNWASNPETRIVKQKDK